jgi:hypothetical protein
MVINNRVERGEAGDHAFQLGQYDGKIVRSMIYGPYERCIY